MAREVTTNIGLRISDEMTADSKYNLRLIDSVFGFIRAGRDGSYTFTALSGIAMLPKGNLAGGTVTVGDPERKVDSFTVWGPAQSSSIVLKHGLNTAFFRIKANPVAQTNVDLTAPDGPYETNDVLAVVDGGQLAFRSLSELGLPVGAQSYSQTFTVASWSPVSANKRYLTIGAATHGLGTTVQAVIYETVGAASEQVGCGIAVNAAGDVTISIDEEFGDNRFAGKVLLTK